MNPCPGLSGRGFSFFGEGMMARLQTLKPRVNTVSTMRVGMANVGEIKRTRGSVWMAIRERIIRRDKGLCQECQRNGRLSEATQIDHITPLHRGGQDNDANLEALCKGCHDAKTAAEMREMRGER